MNALSAPLAALIQMTRGLDPEANLATVDRAMGAAAARGVAMAFLHEMSPMLDRVRTRLGRPFNRKAASAWTSALQATRGKPRGRERECQEVSNSGVDGELNKNKQ